MPNQRKKGKKLLAAWVSNIDILDEYCETTNKTKAEVIEELINSLEKAN
jgi:hypothetical protein